MTGMTVGVFRSTRAAEMAVSQLERLGIVLDRVTVLTPGSSSGLARVPTSDTEQEGMGPAHAGAISGALGLGLGVALFIPGIVPYRPRRPGGRAPRGRRRRGGCRSGREARGAVPLRAASRR
jgi:hypothetical protein